MSLQPELGETPVGDDELEALLPAVKALLGEQITKAAVYDLEQAVQDDVAAEHVTAVLAGDLNLDDLLTDGFLRDLHRQLYGDIWAWAGQFRRTEINIGVAPEQIAVELRGSIETISYRWVHTEDWTARDLGMVVHAEAVRIHPFRDGNGRSTRLWADLVLLSAHSQVAVIFDWEVEKARYIELLRQYDTHRDPRELAAYVGTQEISSM